MCACCRDIVMFIKTASRRHHNSLFFILELRWKCMVSDTTSWFDRCVRGTVNDINISCYVVDLLQREQKSRLQLFKASNIFRKLLLTTKLWITWMGPDFHDLKQSPWPRNLRGATAKFWIRKRERAWSQLFKTSKIFKKRLLTTKLWCCEKKV